MKETIFLVSCLLCPIEVTTQERSIIGMVADTAGGTVIGASVAEVGTINGIITNLDGKFTLMVNPSGKIKVSYIGYQPQVIDIKGRDSFNIKLEEDSKILGEAVVTGCSRT